MSTSAAPASHIASPAISAFASPAFAGGAFSAEDFTSQLEGFKAALAATSAGGATPGSSRQDYSKPQAAGTGGPAKETTPANISATAAQPTLRDFTGPRYTDQPAGTATDKQQQATIPAPPVPAGIASAIQSPQSQYEVPPTPYPAISQHASAVAPTPRKNQQSDQLIAATAPAPTATTPLPDAGATSLAVNAAVQTFMVSSQALTMPGDKIARHFVLNTGAEKPKGTPASNAPASFFRDALASTASSISITRSSQTRFPAQMSFAAKIQAPQQSQQGTPQDAKSSPEPKSQHSATNQDATSAPPVKKALHEEQAPTTVAAVPAPNSTLTAGAAISETQTPAGPTATAPRVETQTVQVAKEPEVPSAVEPKSSAGQLKELSFNIAQPGGSTVQLRIVEHAGELRVAVHTASPELNQDLRADLTDLTKKLSDTGVHSEIWRPDAHGTAVKTQSDSPQNGSQNGSQNNPGNSQSQSGGSQQQGRGQREQNQPQRPKWVEELENGIQSVVKSTGENNGLRS